MVVVIFLYWVKVCADQTNAYTLSSGDTLVTKPFLDNSCNTYDYIQIEGNNFKIGKTLVQ